MGSIRFNISKDSLITFAVDNGSMPPFLRSIFTSFGAVSLISKI